VVILSEVTEKETDRQTCTPHSAAKLVLVEYCLTISVLAELLFELLASENKYCWLISAEYDLLKLLKLLNVN